MFLPVEKKILLPWKCLIAFIEFLLNMYSICKYFALFFTLLNSIICLKRPFFKCTTNEMLEDFEKKSITSVNLLIKYSFRLRHFQMTLAEDAKSAQKFWHFVRQSASDGSEKNSSNLFKEKTVFPFQIKSELFA